MNTITVLTPICTCDIIRAYRYRFVHTFRSTIVSFSLVASRTLTRRRNQTNQLNELIRSLPNRKWERSKTMIVGGNPTYNQGADNYTFSYRLYFNKNGGKQETDVLQNEWSHLVNNVRQQAVHPRWKDSKWSISDISPAVTEQSMDTPQAAQASGKAVGSSKSEFGLPDKLLSFNEIKELLLPRIETMLVDENALRSEFNGIFDREPQIRTVLSSIKSFLATNGKRRNHVLLYGLPACAKTQILLRLKDILGEGAVIRLDATSTTSAGIYKLFFDTLAGEDVPPFVFIEEIEKTVEDALRVWLGALDDRGELRKMNYNMNQKRDINILCLATANDKELFDKLMGGSVKRPGALSSRFVNQLYCPRPTEAVLRMILRRDISKFGGNEDWIEPCIKLSNELNTNDPRKVLAFLDGGDRLLEGTYQDDIRRVILKETEEMHEEPAVGLSNTMISGLNNIIQNEMNGVN